jgi:hypothetical protein
MSRSRKGPAQAYRVWIAQPQAGQCDKLDQVRAPLVVLKPAEPGVMSAHQAGRYVEAFNRSARQLGRSVRAVAIAVAICYEGDLAPGRMLAETEDFADTP